MASGLTYWNLLKMRHLWIICFVVVSVIMLNSSIYNKKDDDSGTKHDMHITQDDKHEMNIRVVDMNITHIKGVFMEHVNLDYPRNIYFTIKTSNKFYISRLFPLMLTWLQTVDKHKVSYTTLMFIKLMLNLKVIENIYIVLCSYSTD